jgi:hypothetical protein
MRDQSDGHRLSVFIIGIELMKSLSEFLVLKRGSTQTTLEHPYEKE